MDKKHFKPSIIALITAGLIILSVSGVFLLCHKIIHLSENLSIFIGGMIGFIIGVFIIKLSINRFIHNRICMIYNMMHDFKVSNKTHSTANFLSKDIEDVEEDTIAYIQAKENEIKQLKKLEDYRKEFLGNVAHELKTPLTAIQGHILTLLDGGINDENINMLYLQRSAFNIDRMIGIVNDLDEIAKLENDRYLLRMEKFNLKELLDEVIDTLDIKAKQLHVKIITDISSDTIYNVIADKENIRKVFVNLIDNAIKYNDKSDAIVKISFFEESTKYLIEITDNGIGIDNQYLPRIFERFFRVDKDRSRKTGGSGLGLAIVKHVIDVHTQNLTVRSELGKGTTFGFTLKKDGA